jgi:hypothetical protein
LFNLILLAGVACTLGYASRYDWEHRLVQWFIPVILILLGLLYVALGYADPMETLGVLIFTGFIFGLPTLFSFGIGDFLIFMGLAFFLKDQNSLFVFLFIFLAVWLIWTFFVMMKWRDKEKLTWRKITTKEYPLVPVILISFLIWGFIILI